MVRAEAEVENEKRRDTYGRRKQDSEGGLGAEGRGGRQDGEPGFEALAGDEQDAWVLGLMLGLSVELAARCVRGEAETGEMAQMWEEIEEVFKYGKRSALRPLKAVLARHETLKKPEAWR